MYKYEIELQKQGYENIAGCDEVGRGPMAGPLVCASVVLDPSHKIVGLNDSKKLTEKKRETLAKEIKKHAKAYHVVFIEHNEIDALNIYKATQKGLLESILGLTIDVDYVLIDAMPLPALSKPHLSIIKGDQKSASIAAASILAKVARDNYMKTIAEKFIGYGFEKNKGYPTKEHKLALEKLGPCEIHRKSYAPVADAIQKQLQLKL